MKVLARVLLGLGVFLLVAAVLAVTWAPGVVKKTPLDVTTVTTYEGQASKLGSEPAPVYAITNTKVDSEASNDSTAVFVTTSCAVFDTGGDQVCVDGEDPNLITASIDTFATDRVTAESVDSSELPADAVPHEGLVNKFPFDAQKKTYPFWDGTLGRAVDIEYQDTEQVDGLETYRYQYTVKDEPIEVAEGVDGTYDNVITVNVDPVTGSIVRSGQDQQRYLPDGTNVLDISVIGNDATVKAAVDEAEANGKSLNLLTNVIPLVGFIGGALCLLAGALLLMRGSRNGQRRNDATPVERTPAGAR